MRGRATDCPGEFGPDAEGPLELSPDRQSNRPSPRRQRACRQREFVEVEHVVPARTDALDDSGDGAVVGCVRWERSLRMQRPLICLVCSVEAQQRVDATLLSRVELESEATQHAERAASICFQKDRSHDGQSDPTPSTGSREPDSGLEYVRLVSQF